MTENRWMRLTMTKKEERAKKEKKRKKGEFD